MKKLREILAVLWGKPVPSVPAAAPGSQSGRVVDSSYENEYPMLPKAVIFRAIDGGFPFMGSLGPENVLDIRFFRSLVGEFKEESEEDREKRALALAHKVYEFYLYYFRQPKEEAQAKAVAFWDEILANPNAPLPAPHNQTP